MKLLILAAGYATRLYPLTLHQAKPLLTVAGRPMIEHILEKFRGAKDLDAVFIVTNARFAADFERWAATFQSSNLPTFQLKIINDGSTSNDDRLGAVGDLDLVLRTARVEDDLVVVAGDNLFTESAAGFLAAARAHAARGHATIATYDVGDLAQVRQKFNSLQTDADGRVTSFIEKDPNATNTITAICLYYFPRATLPFVAKYLTEAKGSPDQPGRYIQWLYPQKLVYTYRLGGLWWDIGSHETLAEADRAFSRAKQQ